MNGVCAASYPTQSISLDSSANSFHSNGSTQDIQSEFAIEALTAYVASGWAPLMENLAVIMTSGISHFPVKIILISSVLQF